MEVKKIGDIMIPLDAYPHIPYWFTLRQAMVEIGKSELEINGTKSLPRVILIFDKEYELVGMVRRRDILRGLEPEFSSGKSLKKLIHFAGKKEVSYKKLVDNLKQHAERQVSEVMIPVKETVEFDDDIVNVIYKMVDNEVSLLPVLKEGKVVGVVRSVEVFNEIAKIVM